MVAEGKENESLEESQEGMKISLIEESSTLKGNATEDREVT